jgi:serine/threonine-protein kinase
MGAVYEAYDQRLARTVALKFLHADLMSNPAARVRFELEALISSQLAHPGVIPVYDIGKDIEGRPFYAMRRVHGETLEAILNHLAQREGSRVERYPLERLLTIFQKVCGTIAFAHSRKIIHRDLKPANIMLSEFGEVFVLDWGLAKPLERIPALEELIEQDGWFADLNGCERERALRLAALRSDTNPNALLGTLGFMAPEQADGNSHEADERTDIYALGAILYNILTLRPPITGERSGHVLQKTASGEIAHPLEKPSRGWLTRGESLPHWRRGRLVTTIANVAMKALSKLPRDRYRSVKDLAEAIPASARS